MTTILALYRGDSIASAKLIAVSADPALVAGVTRQLIGNAENLRDIDDPAVVAIERGRRQSLRRILEEASRGE